MDGRQSRRHRQPQAPALRPGRKPETALIMSVESNKSLYRQYVRVLAYPDRLDEVIAQDFVAHDLPPHFPKGIEGIRSYRHAVMAGFPDQTSEIVDLVAEADKVCARLILRGTHS